MKPLKLLALLVAGIVAVVAIAQISAAFSSRRVANTPAQRTPISPTIALAQTYSDTCLSPTQQSRPVWECYNIPVDTPVHQSVTIQHESGEQYQVLTFAHKEQTQFRFTPTKKGRWTFSTGGEITINADRPPYAKGFVTAKGSKWARSATGQAFVPQFAMYEKLDLDAALDEFVDGHGFTGFHIKNLRDFLDHPDYFEAAVLKTYRRGGATHFWIWGDRARNTTPSTYGVDVDLLYTEIAARLGPIPGWTLGYGFDLFEWASAQELEDLRTKLRENCSYPHLIGGRGHKNEYREISSKLDYTSWEWHHPSYEDYLEHFRQNDSQKPVFSEDRFRIQTPDSPQHYTAEETLRGLWHSAMAGGIANIWGNRPPNKTFSEPYPNKAAIKTYSQFIAAHFNLNMEPDNALISDGYCLRDETKSAICYTEQPTNLRFNLETFSDLPPVITAVDTEASYTEIEVPFSTSQVEWEPPYSSNWAFHITNQP